MLKKSRQVFCFIAAVCETALTLPLTLCDNLAMRLLNASVVTRVLQKHFIHHSLIFQIFLCSGGLEKLHAFRINGNRDFFFFLLADKLIWRR